MDNPNLHLSNDNPNFELELKQSNNQLNTTIMTALEQIQKVLSELEPLKETHYLNTETNERYNPFELAGKKGVDLSKLERVDGIDDTEYNKRLTEALTGLELKTEVKPVGKGGERTFVSNIDDKHYEPFLIAIIELSKRVQGTKRNKIFEKYGFGILETEKINKLKAIEQAEQEAKDKARAEKKRATEDKE